MRWSCPHGQEEESSRRFTQNRSKPAARAPMDARLSRTRLHRRGDEKRRARACQGRPVAAADDHAGRNARGESGRQAVRHAGVVDGRLHSRPRAARFTASSASSRRRTAGSIAAPCAACCAPLPPMSAASSRPATASGFRHADPARDEVDAPTADLEGMIERGRTAPRTADASLARPGTRSRRQRRSGGDRGVAGRAGPEAAPDRRYLASAAKGNIQPIICLNKADLVDPAPYQSIVGFYNNSACRRC